MLVLGALGLLLVFTQFRVWFLLRFLVILQKRPVRLDDGDRSEPLEHLSHGSAVIDVLPAIKYHLRILISSQRALRARAELSSTNLPEHRESPVISPVFGIVALLNIGHCCHECGNSLSHLRRDIEGSSREVKNNG